MSENYPVEKRMSINCIIEDVGDLVHKMYNHRLLFRCFVPIKGIGFKTVKADEISIPDNVAKVDISGKFGEPYDIEIKMTKNSVCSIDTKELEDRYPHTTIRTKLKCE